MKNWRSVWSITSHWANSAIDNNIIHKKHKNMMRPDYHVINHFVRYEKGGNPLKAMDRINKNNLGCTASVGSWKLVPIVSMMNESERKIYRFVLPENGWKKKRKKWIKTSANKVNCSPGPATLTSININININHHRHLSSLNNDKDSSNNNDNWGLLKGMATTSIAPTQRQRQPRRRPPLQ